MGQLSVIGFNATFCNYNRDLCLKKLPAQERVSLAEAQYISNDYASVTKTLKEDTPEELPIGAKYVLCC